MGLSAKEQMFYSPFIKGNGRNVIIRGKGGAFGLWDRIKKPVAVFLVLLMLLFSGCSASDEGPKTETKSEIDYATLDLSAMADEIYRKQDISDLTRKSVSKITDKTMLKEQYYLDFAAVESYEVRSAEGNFGVADLMLLHVKENCAADVMAAIENRKDNRINEFSRYDVYNSYEIALGAEIYQDGELVIMLMFSEDGKAAAKNTINEFLQ